MLSNYRIFIFAVCVFAITACSDSDQRAPTESVDTVNAPAEPVLTQLSDAEPPSEAVVEVTQDTVEEAVATVATPEEQEQETTAAAPQTHIVKGVVTQWEPMIVFANPGDTVRWTNMAGHDTEAVPGMTPEGATLWRSKMGEEGFTVTVDKPGVYIYKCNPHMTTGMVGAIVVGDIDTESLVDLEAGADSIPVGGNMVKRTIRKLKKAMAKRGQ